MVRRDPLEPADGDGLGFDAAATTGRLARPIAHPTEDAGKYIRFTVHQVGVRELT
jgi:hypothetical protein